MRDSKAVINIKNILFARGRMKFRGFFLKALRLAKFLMLNSSLFHSETAEGKRKSF